jgi:transposase
MKKERNTYTIEYKKEAVSLALESEKSQAQIARELGISENLIYNWVKIHKNKHPENFGNETRLSEEQAEIKRLKKELLQVKEEREILKKATAFFARHQK